MSPAVGASLPVQAQATYTIKLVCDTVLVVALWTLGKKV